MTMVIGATLVILHVQEVWTSLSMISPKKHGHHLVSGHRVVNQHMNKVPGVLPDVEAEVERFREASAFATLDLDMWQSY